MNEYRKTCYCTFCGEPVEIVLLLPADKDDCVGVVCEECYEEHKDD